MTWQKLDATTFCDLVTEFLSLHPSLEPLDATDFKNNGFSMAKRRKSTDANCILDANEKDQIAAAIAASLKETKTPKPQNPKTPRRLNLGNSTLNYL